MNAIKLDDDGPTVNAAPTKRRSLVPKLWNEMSDTEKLEVVRKDMNRAYDVLNSLIVDVHDLNIRLNEFTRKTTAALEEIRTRQS